MSPKYLLAIFDSFIYLLIYLSVHSFIYLVNNSAGYICVLLCNNCLWLPSCHHPVEKNNLNCVHRV